MLLDLPRALLEAVYDELHVHDRLRLNAALPKDYRVVKTARTDKVKDEKLALACVAMKRPRQNKKRATAMLLFMAENRDDPTVLSLVADHGLELPHKFVSTLIGRIMKQRGAPVSVSAPEMPVSASEMPVSAPELPVSASDVPADATAKEREEIVDALLRGGTVEQLKTLCSQPSGPLAGHLAARKNVLFMLLNSMNHALFEHVLSKGDELYGLGIEEQTLYVTEGSGRGLLTTPHTREKMVSRLRLSEEQRQTALESALDDMDIAAWKRMQNS